MTMQLHVDRFVLRVPGVDEVAAQRLAALVTEHLGAADVLDHGYAGDRLSLTVTAAHDEGLDSLARRIAAELLRAIARAT